MPDRSAHLKGARSNTELAHYLASSSWKSWATVAAIYAALHAVDAYLDLDQDVHPRSHVERERRIASDPRLRPHYAQYRRLRVRADESRYDLREIADDELFAILRIHQRLQEDLISLTDPS